VTDNLENALDARRRGHDKKKISSSCVIPAKAGIQ
jgi:hypothetical protein